MKNSAGLFSILFIFIFFSCGHKETEPEVTPSSNFDLLTAHEWKGVEVIRFVDGQESTHTPISNNKYIFETDGHYKKFENGTLIQDGTWELIENSMVLIRTRYYSATYNHDILDDLRLIELTADKFSYSLPYIDGSNHILRDDYYFKE